ncbi:Secretion system apparatus protein SsaV [Paraburkholderia domus]|jgi:Type III secretory pathway, component EscV|uniref:Secretion system apparatus protein SsaV n=1 Tax=Paraburkholderia domus TaxID=2793075 RepID=A0A9N8N843_9BURK|nr:flagellar biosynthesis protein FlhA [Paraburkholderia domus]MBK5054166.1 FHIPEP family type III secretion protein [Burkholderia sp. R-70006]MBK5064194.1 FHIPEP family type III secretion protein [Burkholderia sp. R-70199]MBK5091192.1 FHIPEP family type III secretion protein [Burkholderia sp. R-69927]MBK5125506.1 FHIPEP family type III secretion protein [Burkholderia sp. R-69980]MBK5169647.1 FHIPEP family type III secretion protein [Burkholderia sp. R-70211]MBK5185308.1 FHIPEP family type II
MSNRSILSRYDLSAFFARHADLAVGIGILAVLALLIVPVPPFVLDLFICASFAASLTMLSATLYVSKAAELASFPSLLLITTLLRLALAIASTKMILLHAHAGQIIGAFGELVVGGNVAVGLVVFIVLAAIQFIVVAKGADRVAEVAARFTLDGIPGRQMSIDADMRNGVITAAQASRMRAALERETYFYGSLDGAMKFVKGDAVAGLVVALVNIVGGLAVGIAQRGMSFGDALHTYTILTVGDGLVSQIPSLIVSVAAGILVTRVASADSADTHLGADIYRQLALHPKALAMAGVASLSLAAIPGFPHIQFLVAGGLLLALAITLIRNAALATNSQRALMPEMTRDGGNYVPRILDDVELGTSATLRLRLGLKAFDALRPEALNRQLGQLRRHLMVELGVPFPGLALLRDARLESERYIVDIEDVPFASGTLVAAHTLVSGAESLIAFEGVEGYRPRAAKSVWLPSARAASINDPGIHKATVDEALCDHLAEICERSAADFLGTQETRFLLDQLAIEFRELVAQAGQAASTVQLASVLRQLLEQRVPIRNLRAILEAVVRVPPGERTIDRMVREARIQLGRQLTRAYADLETWTIAAAVLDPAWEANLEAQIRSGVDGEPQCVLSAEQLTQVQQILAADLSGIRLVVTHAVLRPHLARVFSDFGWRVEVLAIEEIPLDVYRIQTVATLGAA